MPRKRRAPSPTGIYHWINRGYLKKNIFRFKDDFEAFLSLVHEYKDLYRIKIYHYCLLHNHMHFLLHAPAIDNLSGFSHYVKRRYAYHFSKTHKHAGPTFEKRFGAFPITDDRYLLECGRYIERNPLRAGLVKNPSDYEFSSASWYIRGRASGILTASPAYLALSDNLDERTRIFNDYICQARPEEEYAGKALLAV